MDTNEKVALARRPNSKGKNDCRDKYTILPIEYQIIRTVFYRKGEQDGKTDQA
jgi:hypothetical protein